MIARSTSAASNSRSSSSRSSCSAPVSGSTWSTCSPSRRKTPFMRTSRLDLHHVVVDEVALADGPLVVVAVDEVLEVGHRVGGRRGGEADLDGVEVVERVAPDRELLGCVAAVAFVGDDQVEGVDRDVELAGVVVAVALAEADASLAAEQIDAHPLDRADVDEGVARLRVRSDSEFGSTLGSNFSSSPKSVCWNRCDRPRRSCRT